MTNNQKFIESLITNNILTLQDAKSLLAKFNNNTYELLKFLHRGGAVKKDVLGKLWGDSIGFAFVDLTKTLFQRQLLQLLPEQFARLKKVIPLYKLGEAVTFACDNPSNSELLAETQRTINLRVSFVFSFTEDIDDAIDVEYQSTGSLTQLIGKLSIDSLLKGTSKITEDQIRKLAGDKAIIDFTRGILLLGLKERASDIHIEPDEDFVRIRYRIDGLLQERLKIDSTLLPAVVSRLKIISNLDITEKRRPQDGRISLPLTNRSIDFRVSIMPTIYGEKVVLRILGQVYTREIPDLKDLNFSFGIKTDLERLIETPNGVFFITGPTGSGKTTTLYSVLKLMNKPDINIMTIEDPVEYRMNGINQVQVNTDVGLDFATALRSFLRQDPDIILVGEIRDMVTAKIASQAALTGHMVLATMHTNNALQAVTRLIEIGVEPFLVAPSIIGVMAQRLVRRLCDKCKERYKLTNEKIEDIFIWDGTSEVYFYRAVGCDECNSTGYSGRIAIHELFIMNSQIRRLISKDASILEIQQMAKETGYKPLRYDGIKKVIRGLTSIEEINKITVADDI